MENKDDEIYNELHGLYCDLTFNIIRAKHIRRLVHENYGQCRLLNAINNCISDLVALELFTENAINIWNRM